MLAIVSDHELATTSEPVLVRSADADLAKMVRLMRSSEHVVGVITGGGPRLDPGEDVLTRLLAPNAQIQTQTVVTHDDKLRCIAAVTELLDATKTSRERKQPIQQCVDELVMNALYDAPLDAAGRRLFADITARDRIRMRTDREVSVRFGYDGKTFALAVRDTFGCLERATVVRFLEKGLHSASAVDRGTSGAGLGLYLVATAASLLQFTVMPGVATEVVCAFELAAAPKLGQLAFFPVAADRPPLPPARRIVVTRRHPWLFRGAVALTAGLVVATTLAVGHRYFGSGRPARLTLVTEPGATVEIDARPVGTAGPDGRLELTELHAGLAYRVVVHRDGFGREAALVHPQPGSSELALPLRPIATVEIDTDPADATVIVDGKTVGATPLALTSLAPGSAASLELVHPGYRTASKRVVAPAAGQRVRLAQQLEPATDVVRVTFTSIPPGAAIFPAGRAPGSDRTYTPAEMYLPVGKTQSFTLVMAGYKPFAIEPFVASNTNALEKGGTLVKD